MMGPMFGRMLFGAVRGAVGGGGGGGASSGGGRRRRRRARLTQSQMLELTQIRNILGRTAAANALPFYLGRK